MSSNAKLLMFSDSPPGYAGHVEDIVCAHIQEGLHQGHLLIKNLNLPTSTSFFYEYDLIHIGPGTICVIEVKHIIGKLLVHEDLLETEDGHRKPSVFSIVCNKAKVLGSRLRDRPFNLTSNLFVDYKVLIYPAVQPVEFRHRPHLTNKRVLSIADYIRLVGRNSNLNDPSPLDLTRIKQGFEQMFQDRQRLPRRSHYLGPYLIRKPLQSKSTTPEYQGVDEHPCAVDVHLKEFPHECLPRDQLRNAIHALTKEMRTLRRLRHPYVRCVIGHFSTGASLVQVSDWFDGVTLEASWTELSKLVLNERLELMVKIVEALDYCHLNSIFHRNISADSVLVNYENRTISLIGFSQAKDLESTTYDSVGDPSANLENLIAAPEVLANMPSLNYRLVDVFQLGILYFRIVTGGNVPFGSTLDWVTSADPAIPRPCPAELGFPFASGLNLLIEQMLSVEPSHRPNAMSKVHHRLLDLIP